MDFFTAAYCERDFAVNENVTITFHPRWPQLDDSSVVIIGSVASLQCPYPFYIVDNVNYTCEGPAGQWAKSHHNNQLQPHCSGNKL